MCLGSIAKGTEGKKKKGARSVAFRVGIYYNIQRDSWSRQSHPHGDPSLRVPLTSISPHPSPSPRRPRISSRNPSRTLASGDALNTSPPSPRKRSIAARARITTACSETASALTLSRGLVRIIFLINSNSSGLESRSTCSKSSCRNRCHGSPLIPVSTQRDRASNNPLTDQAPLCSPPSPIWSCQSYNNNKKFFVVSRTSS